MARTFHQPLDINQLPLGASCEQKSIYQNLRLPNERVRLGQNGRRHEGRRGLRAHPRRRRSRPHFVQHLLGA